MLIRPDYGSDISNTSASDADEGIHCFKNVNLNLLELYSDVNQQN